MRPMNRLAAARRLLGQSEFRAGLRDLASAGPGLAAWGLVTGVAMAKSGLGLGLAIVISLTVYAGTAQLAALPLIATAAPLWLVLGAAYCVNLRFVVFGAQMRPYVEGLGRLQRLGCGYLIGDINQALMLKRYPQADGSPAQLHYFFGLACGNWLFWQIPSLAGIVLASVFPDGWGIDFAGTLALLAIAAGLLVDRTAAAAMLAAAAASTLLVWLPLRLNLAAAIALALLVGMGWDAWITRARPAQQDAR